MQLAFLLQYTNICLAKQTLDSFLSKPRHLGRHTGTSSMGITFFLRSSLMQTPKSTNVCTNILTTIRVRPRHERARASKPRVITTAEFLRPPKRPSYSLRMTISLRTSDAWGTLLFSNNYRQYGALHVQASSVSLIQQFTSTQQHLLNWQNKHMEK